MAKVTFSRSDIESLAGRIEDRGDAPMPFKGVPKHGFVDNALRSRVERRRQLLQGLFPPIGNEPPAHRHELGAAAIDRLDDIHGIRWRNVVVRLEITGGACQAIQVVEFAPRVALGESSAHGVNLRLRERPAPLP
jgi:hypothetical protein